MFFPESPKETSHLTHETKSKFIFQRKTQTTGTIGLIQKILSRYYFANILKSGEINAEFA